MLRRLLSVALLVAPCDAWISIAQRWPGNSSVLWRPEEISARGGAISALWTMPDTCATLTPRAAPRDSEARTPGFPVREFFVP